MAHDRWRCIHLQIWQDGLLQSVVLRLVKFDGKIAWPDTRQMNTWNTVELSFSVFSLLGLPWHTNLHPSKRNYLINLFNIKKEFRTYQLTSDPCLWHILPSTMISMYDRLLKSAAPYPKPIPQFSPLLTSVMSPLGRPLSGGVHLKATLSISDVSFLAIGHILFHRFSFIRSDMPAV